MTRALRLQILAALGVAPMAIAGCNPVGAVGSLSDDDEDYDEDEEGGGGGAGGSGWDSRPDHDGDGWPVGDDCDDSDPLVNPGAYEQCNDSDDDCDGLVDEGLEVFDVFRDADQDGYGDPDDTVQSCTWPSGYVGNGEDCDDTDRSVNPGASEICDAKDNDCDGKVDLVSAYVDEDGDGYAGTAGDWDACEDLPGGVDTYPSDCDDTDDTVHPDAEEICGDQVDNDCNGFASCLALVYEYSDWEEETCAYSWQAQYLEAYDYLEPFGSFSVYGNWSPIEPWDTTCATPYDEYFDVYVDGEQLSTQWGTVGATWTGRRLDFDETVDNFSYRFHLTGELWLDEVLEYTGGEGRPFTVDGRPRIAAAADAPGWAAAVEAASPPPHLRSRIARIWETAARDEHASVASFARFALELMALGAPADLLAEASRAMADEIDHARRCFGLAEALGGRAVGVGELDVARSLDAAGDPLPTLLALLSEGCVEETLAAARAAEAARLARDPHVREALAVIAEDEARHAAYAWRCAKWILDQHPDLADLARDTLEIMAPSGPLPAPDPEARGLAAFGVLDAHTRARVARDAWAEVVAPATRALLTRSSRVHA